jgi:hypothetical protein
MKLCPRTPYAAPQSGYCGSILYGLPTVCNWLRHSWPPISIRQDCLWYVWMRASLNARGGKGSPSYNAHWAASGMTLSQR